MDKAPHISIKGETVLDLFGFPVTNSLLTSLIVTLLFVLLALYYISESKKDKKSTLFYIISGINTALYSLFESILGKNVTYFFNLLVALFFFIILNNYAGLLPGVHSVQVVPHKLDATGFHPMEDHKAEQTKASEVVTPEDAVKEAVTGEEAHEEAVPAETTADDHSEAGNAAEATAAAAGTEEYAEEAHAVHKVPLFRGATADLNTTVALALISVILTQIFGFKFIGAGHHLSKYASPIGLLEGFTELSRLLSFSFRLFGNIFAGEVILVVVSFLVPFLTPPFFLLEVFVGFIQAVVFTMLTAVFINLAIQKHH